MPATSRTRRFFRPAVTCETWNDPRAPSSNRRSTAAWSSVVTATVCEAAPDGPAKVSDGPTGRCRSGWTVARSAITERIGRPATNCARSIQCVPMSATARRFVPPSGSTRQL